MTNLTVAHVFITGKTNGSAVRLELAVQVLLLGLLNQSIDMGRVGEVDTVTTILLPHAKAVEDDQEQWALGGFTDLMGFRQLVQLIRRWCHLLCLRI